MIDLSKLNGNRYSNLIFHHEKLGSQNYEQSQNFLRNSQLMAEKIRMTEFKNWYPGGRKKQILDKSDSIILETPRSTRRREK